MLMEIVGDELYFQAIDGRGTHDRFRSDPAAGHESAKPATIASTRSGLPLPLTIFSGAAITTAPVGGS